MEETMAKPDFTGTWKLNVDKSSLQIPIPESTLFLIKHKEPQFHLERTHVIDGISDAFTIDITTDGTTVVSSHRGIEIVARLLWDGENLLFDTRLTREGKQAINIVRYSLEDK